MTEGLNVATSVIMTSSFLIASLALMGIIASAVQARPLPPPENSSNKVTVIVMVNDQFERSISTETMKITGNDDCDNIEEYSIKGKVAPPPPSPKSSPPTHPETTNYYPPPKPSTPVTPNIQLETSCAEGSSACNSLNSMFTNFGKTPKSPPSPKPSPSKHQGKIEQRAPPHFHFKSLFNNFGKTPISPPSPKPAPPKIPGIIELRVQQGSPPDVQAF